MKLRQLGDSDLQVSEISLGSWLTYSGGIARDQTKACTRAAFDAEINFFDTANVYGAGAAEEAWGEILSDYDRDSYILATKVYFQMSETDRGLSAEQIAKQIDASLRRLRTDYVDLYQCHRFDTETPIEETMEALTAVVDSGKARYLGFSEWTPEQIQAGWMWPAPPSSSPRSPSTTRSGARRRPTCSSSAPPTGSRRSSGHRWPRGCSPASTSRAPRPRQDSRAANEEMSVAIERYMSEEVLEAVRG